MAKENDVTTVLEGKEVIAKPSTPAADGGAPAVAVVTEGASEMPVQNRVKAYWASKFPDKGFADDAEFDGLLADYLSETDRKLEKHAMAEETFRRVAGEHPELLDIVEDLAADKEMTLAEAIYRNVDTGEFLPEEGEPDFDRMRKVRQERMARETEAQAFRNKLAENLEQSKKVISDYFRDNDIPEDEQKALADYVDEIMDKYTQNLITTEIMDAFRRARNYSRDVAQAQEIGAIAAKNARVDAQRRRRDEATDGLPSSGSAAGVLPPPEETSPLGRVVDRIARKQSITNSLFTKP